MYLFLERQSKELWFKKKKIFQFFNYKSFLEVLEKFISFCPKLLNSKEQGQENLAVGIFPLLFFCVASVQVWVQVK